MKRLRLAGRSPARTLAVVLVMLAGSLLASIQGGSGEASIEEIEIVAQRFHFTPSKLKVRTGARLRLTLKSRDTFHGFRLEGSDINVVIPARGRGSVTVNWEAPEPGRYRFSCSKPCGAGHTQMRGWILVE